MSLKRFVSWMAFSLLCLGLAAPAQAGTKKYAVVGGGAQIAFGNRLPMPPQVISSGVTGSVFPSLRIPVKPGTLVEQTTTRTTRRQIHILHPVLSLPPAQRTVALFAQNSTLYAAATNLGWAWPAAPGVLSTNGRPGPVNTCFAGSLGTTVCYSNPSGMKFGGPARFAISVGAQPQGRIANAPVTLYAVALPGPGNPPCTHTALAGPNPACVAALIASSPPTTWAIGATGSVTAMPITPPAPGIGIGKFGASPLGTVSAFFFTANGNPGLTDQPVMSVGFPWTTGRITISYPFATVFTITGMDNRTLGGAGTIQLVSASLSMRTTTGPSVNRGWVRLHLREVNRTPTMSPGGLAATAGLILLGAAYAIRRRLSA